MFFYNESDSEVSYEQPVIPEDPYFYNTSLLLKMDSDFGDSSVYQHAVTANGNTAISSAESKYGGGSGYFDGSGDRLVISPASDELEFGNENYTVEFWMNPVPTLRGALFSKGLSNSLGTDFLTLEFASDNKLLYALGSTASTITTTTAFTTGQWYHIAVVRNGDTTSLYVNGIEDGSFNSSYTISTGGDFLVGRGWYFDAYNRDYNGYIDDFRVTKGVARYTANFTPPDSHPTTGPSEIVSTDLQLHLDAGDTNSYSGTGTTWFDLSGNGYHHTLTNPTYEEFVSAYGFNINENGKGIRDAGSTFTYGEQYTIQVWAAALSDSQAPNYRTLLRSDPNDHALLIQKDTNTIGYYDNDGGGGFVSYGLNAGTLGLENNWALYTIVGNAGSTTLYINGLSHSGTVPKTLSGNQHRSIGATTPSPVQPFGRIAVVTTYSRTLSSAEILQNFNATKSRFGL